MKNALDVCDSVARQITPSDAERRSVERVVEQVQARLVAEAEREGLEAEVSLNGSVAKDTWLKGDVDVDVFLRVPASLSRAELEGRCLRVAKRALKGHRIVERFAEHPYIETHVGKVRVNVVPCYNVVRGEWQSATDRTPFHTEYVKSHLAPDQRIEVRLLKRFLKGIDVYGADVKVSGFSGMLTETLVMYYGSFTETLKQAQSWKPQVRIDVENHYGGREPEMADLFEEPLVVIDPVDRGRNLAASISRRKLWEFVAATRAFSKKPSKGFFFPRKTALMSVQGFRREMQRRGWNLVALEFGRVDAVVDVLWSQLYRTERSLRNLFRQEGYNVTRSASWSNEEDLNVILLELENVSLPPVRKHVGPPVAKAQASELFFRKHMRRNRTISGPWIDDERWAVSQLRENRNAATLLRSKICDGGRQIGVASKIAPVLRQRCTVLAGQALVGFYREEREAARFITGFLKGRPAWLG